jgi:hypothetical protein
MNGYRPIVELMNTNFGIYGMAEISSAGEPALVPSLIKHKYVKYCILVAIVGNTYATTGGQFAMPMTIIGAGGTAPNQALGKYVLFILKFSPMLIRLLLYQVRSIRSHCTHTSWVFQVPYGTVS